MGERPYVTLNVLRMPSDRTVVAGIVSLRDSRPMRPGFGVSATPMPLDVACRLALKIARQGDFGGIEIRDPNRLWRALHAP